MNKLKSLTTPPENNRFLTRSLPFAATLTCLGFDLKDTILANDGQVSFVFLTKGENVQSLYDEWHIRDIKIGTRRFVTEWRKLRRLIDAVRR